MRHEQLLLSLFAPSVPCHLQDACSLIVNLLNLAPHFSQGVSECRKFVRHSREAQVENLERLDFQILELFRDEVECISDLLLEGLPLTCHLLLVE